ncbi:ABC transporter permease [Cellulomonas sp. S1-8]|uniref:ABC transporter permease n=1 Tax=Cellulomonas sp. S1-8 TaxID=2904790 RepID=UPI002244099C|nr:ABC-2 family transporter protein [Cellulomonas sp. S1-8]UZN03267.1 ABC transporter permease [Cellulomonas sp. S1-8]
MTGTGVVETARVCRALLGAAGRSAAQYRGNLVLMVVMGVAYQGSGFAFIAVVLSQYPEIGGWTFREVALLYGLRLMAHALYNIPLQVLWYQEDMIRDGSFDRFLLRPLHPFLQLLTSRVTVNSFGDALIALAVFAYASSIAEVTWTPLTVLYVTLAIIGGALIEGAVQVTITAASFRTVEVWPARFFADNVILSFASYPLSVFSGALQWVLTWVLPIAFIAYVPADAVLDRDGGLSVTSAAAWLVPLVGLVCFAAAYRVWRHQLDRYASTGT